MGVRLWCLLTLLCAAGCLGVPSRPSQRCDAEKCIRGIHIGNLCSKWMLKCLRNQYSRCNEGRGQGRTAILVQLNTILKTQTCEWTDNAIVNYIIGRSQSLHSTLTSSRNSQMTSSMTLHTRPRRSPQDTSGGNLQSLMNSMFDIQRQRVNAMTGIMTSAFNASTGSDGNINPLLLAGMGDDGPFDDGPLDDVMDDDMFDDDGVMGLAILSGSLGGVAGTQQPPLAPRINIDQGGAALMRDHGVRQDSGAVSLGLGSSLLLVCLVLTRI